MAGARCEEKDRCKAQADYIIKKYGIKRRCRNKAEFKGYCNIHQKQKSLNS